MGWVLTMLFEHEQAIGSFIANTLFILQELFKVCIKLVHWLGTLVMLLLTIISLAIIWHMAAVELGWESSTFPTLYEAFERNALNKALWGAVTIVFATTAGIRHLWNYEVNHRKFMSDEKERWKREYEERRKEKSRRCNPL